MKHKWMADEIKADYHTQLGWLQSAPHRGISPNDIEHQKGKTFAMRALYNPWGIVQKQYYMEWGEQNPAIL